MTHPFSDYQVIITRLDHPSEQSPLIALFAQIVEEQSWQPHNQLYAYPLSSVYFEVKVEGVLAGGLQLVRSGSSEGLPCLTVWPELALQDRSDVADVALFAVAKPYRGKSHLFWRTLVEAWRYSDAHMITELWMELAPPDLRVYRRLGVPLEIRGPLRPHWGEECYPCCMGIAAIEEVFIAKAKQVPLYRAIVAHAYRDRPGALEQALSLDLTQ